MKAWIFDIDGVITNLLKQRVEKEGIIEEIDKRLQNGEIVSFITGRGFWWVEQNVLPKMKKIISDPSLHSKLFIVCEFGGINVWYENGEQNKKVDEEVRVPEIVFEKGLEIFESYQEFIEQEEKETLFTLKVRDGADFGKFKDAQKKIALELREMLTEIGLDKDFEVHTDRLGINIRHKKSTKHLAIQKFLKWTEENHDNPDEYIVFGDSQSDIEMGEELLNQGKKFTLVYVGEDLGGEHKFKIIRTNKHYDEGTLEYLLSN